MTNFKMTTGDKISWGIVLFVLVVAWFLLQAWPVHAQGMPTTTEGIQAMLMNPWVLFGLMIFGTILSMLKQWKQAQMDGSTTTLATYLAHVQELLIAIGGNAIAFFLLVDSGNLNFVSAISIGYVLNSVADLNPAGSRSTSLTALTLK